MVAAVSMCEEKRLSHIEASVTGDMRLRLDVTRPGFRKGQHPGLSGAQEVG